MTDIRLKITSPFNNNARHGEGEWVEYVADHPDSDNMIYVRDEYDLMYCVHKGRIRDKVEGKPEPL